MNRLLVLALNRILGGSGDLGYEFARQVFDGLLRGAGDPELIAAFLVAIHIRGESESEFMAALDAVRSTQQTLEEVCGDAIDIGGTGGDCGATFNISTTAALVAAAADVTVCKHGNVAVTGQCGSMDLVSRIGLPVARTQAEAAEQLACAGIIFLHSRDFLKYPPLLQSVRRKLGVRTIFNLLGPWCNPARVRRQVIGVSNRRDLPLFVATARALRQERVLIVHGSADKSDEFSISGETQIAEVELGSVTWYQLHPSDFGLEKAPLHEISGGDRDMNAKHTLDIIEGRERGPRRSIVLMTAASAIYIAGHAQTIRAGVDAAREAIDSGRVTTLVRRLRNLA
jgi:anthranilate phosphoribosyltransferase